MIVSEVNGCSVSVTGGEKAFWWADCNFLRVLLDVAGF
jgi:hypothetical protein